VRRSFLLCALTSHFDAKMPDAEIRREATQ
jgi:hypothetical protein